MYELLCSSGFCGLMIVAGARVMMPQMSEYDAKLLASYGVAYNNIHIS